MMRITLIGLAVLSLCGCATDPDDMAATYTSPLQYQAYDCDQIKGEIDRVTRRAQELYIHLDRTASNDSMQMAAGVALLWPALFFLEGGDGPQAAEYTRLKGERDALEQAAIQKKCGLVILHPATADPDEAKAGPTK